MMVIGIGIDYVLLLVTRFREWRSHGLDVEDATVATLDTAGRAVALAGTTVIVSMLGLAGMVLSYMRGASLATIVGVVVVLAATLTLLPALLGFWGRKLDRLRIPVLHRRQAASSRGWLRWNALVARHRYLATGTGLVIMLAIAAPFLSVQFGTPDEGNNAKGSSTRTAYEMTAAGFGAGANGPLLVVLEDPTAAMTAKLTKALRTTPGVAAVQPAVTSSDGRAALITVVPQTGPQDARTASLVHHLRNVVLPKEVTDTSVVPHVGGTTAAQIDADANVVKRIPFLLAAVVGLSMLLMLVSFRSIAIAVKAAALNLLSVAAAYGAVALALQGGWFGQLFGIDTHTPLPAFVPVLMFAVLFALSADYEIFLVSRIRDGYKRDGDATAAIGSGLAGTARVITAAAAIMIAVFAAFIPSSDIAVKVIGVGMAAAILLDATVVRMLLVPAIMHILGPRAWELPRWLDRRLPQLAVEGHEDRYLPAPLIPQQRTVHTDLQAHAVLQLNQ
jgi:RND superfamily putative drug exporter